LIARLTKSFPRGSRSDRPVVSASGLSAVFVVRGAITFLEIKRADGREAIQPYAVAGPDTASLSFDPTGTRLVWDEMPNAGRRRTRLLDLTRARLLEPAALAEPELLSATSRPVNGEGADRYTTFIGFSPDGLSLLVTSEGFTSDGTRIPRRHYLCDAEGKRQPVIVERPFSGPGVVDWDRIERQPG
jgi:hypothetical protein